MNTIPVTLTVSETDYTLQVSVEEGTSAALTVDTAIQLIDGEHYEGEYTVTPSATAQTLATEGLVMTQDVTIAPIPNNYGLITWDGSVLTVS